MIVDGEGIVKVDGKAVEDELKRNYEEDENIDLKAIPAEGWEFSGWEDFEENGMETSVTMKNDTEITASFEEVDDKKEKNEKEDDEDSEEGASSILRSSVFRKVLIGVLTILAGATVILYWKYDEKLF
ncbi:MAG: hypothetical protein KGY66_01065 [Candidatus Thermoplasmatota archaeon]|nr:hypothetical protein [Candidatus Thermoplasmatota archaeon]MBS3789490.1 hypothetical protein [Candidatus Thermoplasmatota archaeon]